MRLLNLDLAALILLAGVIPLNAAAEESAQDYPQRPIKLVIGWPSGADGGMIARLVAEYMGEGLGQRVIVEHKPGAGSNIAAEAVSRSEPNGYTLFLGGRPNIVHKVMYPSIEYDFARDLAPVGVIGTTTPILVAGMHTPIHSVQDLVRMAKERPGQLTYASVGVGGSFHLISEVLQEAWGIDLSHIPYRGSAAAITDMIGGRIDVMVSVPGAALAYIKTGKLRPLAVLGHARLPTLPDVPTMVEIGLPAQEYHTWYGLLTPTGTPPEVIERLSKALNAALKNPVMLETMSQSGFDAAGAPNGPEEFRKFIAAETELWTEVARRHGVGQEKARGEREGVAVQTGASGNRAN